MFVATKVNKRKKKRSLAQHLFDKYHNFNFCLQKTVAIEMIMVKHKNNPEFVNHAIYPFNYINDNEC